MNKTLQNQIKDYLEEKYLQNVSKNKFDWEPLDITLSNLIHEIQMQELEKYAQANNNRQD